MHIEISNSGAFGSALVSLDPGEEFVSEAGAMFRASSNVDIDVTTRSRSTGGIMSGLRRILAQENLFFSRYSVTTNRVAEVGLAPTLQGQIALIECAGDTRWVCAGGSYLGSAADLNIDTKFQGLRGMLSGESLSFITVEGIGALLVNAFGLISGVDVDGGLTVDTRTRGGVRGDFGLHGQQGRRKLDLIVPDERGAGSEFQRPRQGVRAESQSRRVRQEPRSASTVEDS